MARILTTPRPAKARPRALRPQLDALEGRLLLNAGDLDTTFGTGGSVVTPFYSGGRSPTQVSAVANAVTTQTVGGQEKIVVVGTVTLASGQGIALARYNPDGSPDTGFGTGGKVVTSLSGGSLGSGRHVAVQPDGKIVEGTWSPSKGTSEFAVVRYNPNGSPDTTFGPNHSGIVLTAVGFSVSSVKALALQPDGKIVVGGSSTQGSGNADTLVRYNTNGTLDTSFGTGGIVKAEYQPGSSIDYVNGVALETITNPDGTTTTKIVTAGSIIGSLSSRFAVARYNLNGSLDTTFGNGGFVLSNYGQYSGFTDVAIQPNGMIVAGGAIINPQDGTNDFAAVRYDTSGNPDPGFGPNHNGLVTSNRPGADGGNALALQPDGKIVLVGYTQASDGHGTPSGTLVARFNADGSFDTTFGNGGFAFDSFGTGNNALATVLQSDGKIVTAGAIGINPSGPFTASFVVARFLGDPPPALPSTAATASPTNVTPVPDPIVVPLVLDDPGFLDTIAGTSRRHTMLRPS